MMKGGADRDVCVVLSPPEEVRPSRPVLLLHTFKSFLSYKP